MVYKDDIDYVPELKTAKISRTWADTQLDSRPLRKFRNSIPCTTPQSLADMWGTYCCLTNFFRLSIHALFAKIQPDKVVRWCAGGIFCVIFLRHFCVIFCVLYFQRAACSTFLTCMLNSHWPHHVWYGRHPICDR